MTKLFNVVLGMGFLAMSVVALADPPPPPPPTVIPTEFSTGYIPDGFDTNDNSQIVAEGFFPNTCYRPAEVTTQIDHVKKTVKLSANAYFYSGLCGMMIVNYHKVMDLGLMQAGTYKVIQGETGQELGQLTIREATNSYMRQFHKPTFPL